MKLFFWQKEHDDEGNLVSSVVSLMEQPESDLSEKLEKKQRKSRSDESSSSRSQSSTSRHKEPSQTRSEAPPPAQSQQKTQYDLATSGNRTIPELSRKGQPLSEVAWNVGEHNSVADDEEDED